MKTIVTIMLAIVVSAAQVWAGGVGDAVEVRIVTDDGRTLPTYPVKMRSGLKKVYAEAARGDHYRVEVRNRLNRRVGVVIAVDGRNIISGEKSWLKSSERMYILEPFGSGEFAGWRSGQDRINRFYFTDVPDSYAAAFGDESAMGVITVAAYAEVRRYEPPPMPTSQSNRQDYENKSASGAAALDRASSAPAAPAPAAESMRKKAGKQEKSLEGAGTGYGREEFSPVRTVEFEAEKRAVETIHVKYEWRSTLCKLGVVRCDLPLRRPANRLWDNGGYAPPPPGRS
ncbi:MAG: hypothetical protein WCP20_18350 [Desulfuromonadales bacterium]